MGLDSYLSVKRSKYLKDGERTIDLDDMSGDKFDDYKSDEFGVSNRVEITEQVCYFRKANQIHRWFVDNVQGGEDKCQESYVDEDKLNELYVICRNIVDKLDGVEFTIKEDSKKYALKYNEKFTDSFKFDWSYDCKISKELKEYIEENLPCGEGFFFGSCEYDGGYVYDLIKTILMFDRLFKKLNGYKKNKVWVDIVYQASW